MGPLPKDMDDVGMGQPSQQRGLALQATAFFRVGRKRGQEDLTREGTDIGNALDLV
jgi:hypothetical protein